jgi:hypothetical protein
MDSNREGSPLVSEKIAPVAPPLPGTATSSYHGSRVRGYCCASTATKDLWERLFDEGYRADVSINTDNGGIIYAHANILVSQFIPCMFNLDSDWFWMLVWYL